MKLKSLLIHPNKKKIKFHAIKKHAFMQNMGYIFVFYHFLIFAICYSKLNLLKTPKLQKLY